MCEENSVDDLFNNNIDLVKRLVNKLYNYYYDKEDLYQVGLMGLYNASLHFDKNKNVKFTTYAVYYILGEIKRELKENRLIKYSQKMYKVKKLIKEGNSINKIIANENVSTSFVIDVYCKSFDLSKIDCTNFDYIKDNTVNNNIFKIAKECLTEKQYNVIINKYIYKLSQNEISKMIGVNQATVSRLESKALNILKNNIDNYK